MLFLKSPPEASLPPACRWVFEKQVAKSKRDELEWRDKEHCSFTIDIEGIIYSLALMWTTAATSTPIKHHNNPKNNNTPIHPQRRRQWGFPVSVRGRQAGNLSLCLWGETINHGAQRRGRPYPASCLLFSALQGLGKYCIKVGFWLGRGRVRG